MVNGSDTQTHEHDLAHTHKHRRALSSVKMGFLFLVTRAGRKCLWLDRTRENHLQNSAPRLLSFLLLTLLALSNFSSGLSCQFFCCLPSSYGGLDFPVQKRLEGCNANGEERLHLARGFLRHLSEHHFFFFLFPSSLSLILSSFPLPLQRPIPTSCFLFFSKA